MSRNIERSPMVARLTLLCAAWLAGCSAIPQLPPLRAGEPVAIVAASAAPTAADTRIQNRELGSNAATGAGTGMLAGGMSGLSCGPFAVLCVPAGMLVGSLVGGAAGTVVGVTATLPDDKAAQLRARLARAREAHDPIEEVRRNLADRTRSRWQLDSPSPRSTITLELQELLLSSTRDERIGLEIRVLVSVRTGLTAEPTRKVFEYLAPQTALAIWLDERSDFVDNLLTLGSQQIAAQLVSELAGP
jgi:hypothetical protein